MSKIIQSISQSRKYKPLYYKTIERLVEQSLEKYGPKHAEEKARNLLHQIWGAYYATRPNFKKLLEKFASSFDNEKSIKEALLPILSLHASTKERLSILTTFYQRIFDVTGIPKTIIDHACGLNPLTIPWMDLPSGTTYYAYDIDEEQTEFLRNIIKQVSFENETVIETKDIFVDTFPHADIVFMLKLLPVFEHQEKNSSLKIMRQQNCNFLVVSFPIKSIGGKEKGMMDFYTQKFLDDIKNEGWEITKLLFVTEVVFIVKK